MTAYDERVIAEFRASGGRVEGFGSALVLLHSTGAKTGEPRISPVAAMIEGGSWLIVASAGGAPANPGWYWNLVQQPDCVIETPAGSVDVHAIELLDEEWDDAWARFTARSPGMLAYRERAAPRHIPILRLEPRG